MKVVFDKTPVVTDHHFQFCPGCTHGITIRLIGEVLEQMGLANRAVGLVGDGCMSWSLQYLNIDYALVLYGRGAAVGTGLKRVNPGTIVYALEGDGDLGSGVVELLHAASYGEPITMLFVNNTTMGMTHGQMAATSLPGQVTTTTPGGRDVRRDGYPMDFSSLVAQQGGVSYLARASLHDAKHIAQAKTYLKRAFEAQLEGRGFSMVEFLSACPTNWKMQPVDAARRVAEEMIPAYPIGELVGGRTAREEE